MGGDDEFIKAEDSKTTAESETQKTCAPTPTLPVLGKPQQIAVGNPDIYNEYNEHRNWWTQQAIIISWVSISLTMATGCTGLIYALLFDSMAMLGYGLNSFVDVFSSILVLWRFSQSHRSDQLAADEAYNRRLEKKAGVGISITFVGIALLVGAQASAHLVETQKPTDDEALLILAAASVMVFTVTACIKWFISGQLQSSTLMKDAISSFAVAVLSLGVCISASAYKADHHVWWFDAVVALITSVLLFTYGARTLFCHGHHWWQLSWWTEDLSGTDSEGQHLLGVGPQGESDSKTS